MSGNGRTVDLVSTGTANIASVRAALRRLGYVPRVVDRADEVESSRALVLPGVGTFGAALATLRERELEVALRERVASGRPLLCICVGLQVLCRASEESPNVEGLGILPLSVARFARELRVPQMGWNEIRADVEDLGLRTGFAYFANSYRIGAEHADTLRDGGWSLAIAEHGAPFVAAIERDGVLACQFHLELSGRFGADMLNRWLERSFAC